eukprot:1095106-Heterocapsa_arctica.AAC.1
MGWNQGKTAKGHQLVRLGASLRHGGFLARGRPDGRRAPVGLRHIPLGHGEFQPEFQRGANHQPG